MPVWRALLIVYPEIDVRLPVGGGRTKPRFRYRASEQEIEDATGSFRAFPALASRLTKGAAQVEASIVHSSKPLKTVTRESGSETFWPSPDDTRSDLDSFAPAGTF